MHKIIITHITFYIYKRSFFKQFKHMEHDLVLITLNWLFKNLGRYTSLRWNWGIFAQTCSTCLEGSYRKDSSGLIPVGRKTGPERPEYLPRAVQRHSCYSIQNREFSAPLEWGHRILPCRNENCYIKYPDIFFCKYNSPYHIEMCTYVLIDLLWAGGSVAPAQPTSLNETEEFLPKHVPQV